VKIKLTKAGGFHLTNFGVFLEVKRKGRILAASQAATEKKREKSEE
jgi:hypothetical protein